jgi:hypothetical protein
VFVTKRVEEERKVICFSYVFIRMKYVQDGGCRVLSTIVSIDEEECGARILQVPVNFTCYYRMPKDWNPETYTQLQKYILKYFQQN